MSSEKTARVTVQDIIDAINSLPKAPPVKYYLPQAIYDWLQDEGKDVSRYVPYSTDQLPNLGSHTHVHLTLDDIAKLQMKSNPALQAFADQLQKPEPLLDDADWEPT